MDILQRIQCWYTINCDGDWEHDHGVSIATLDNPGWYVIIDLQDTCLEKAVLPNIPVEERSPTNWVTWHIEDYKFMASGGPMNLSEILSYFLDTLLPEQKDDTLEYKVYIPLKGYEGLIWRLAHAMLVTESQLRIIDFPNPESTSSYSVGDERGFEPFSLLEATSLESVVAVAGIGDLIEVTIEEHQFSTDLVYTSHVR
ncbi:immunity 53 family protein [Hymenobacter sp. UYP22]|uniref:immunity 53 family protein n=1 Tax=Hymenobacter sp. UYP22 TaxID=3156348 RepID=UPI0033987418